MWCFLGLLKLSVVRVCTTTFYCVITCFKFISWNPEFVLWVNEWHKWWWQLPDIISHQRKWITFLGWKLPVQERSGWTGEECCWTWPERGLAWSWLWSCLRWYLRPASHHAWQASSCKAGSPSQPVEQRGGFIIIAAKCKPFHLSSLQGRGPYI